MRITELSKKDYEPHLYFSNFFFKVIPEGAVKGPGLNRTAFISFQLCLD